MKNDAISRYQDIIDLPHPEPKRHPRMPMRDRAAQFAPFKSLVGLEGAMDEVQRESEKRVASEIDRE